MSTIGETLPPLPTVEFDKGKLRLLPSHTTSNNNNNLREAPQTATSNQGQRDERNSGPLRSAEPVFYMTIKHTFLRGVHGGGQGVHVIQPYSDYPSGIMTDTTIFFSNRDGKLIRPIPKLLLEIP